MNVLVTGGAGFIGSNLVDRLVSEGHSVTVIDNLSTGKKANVNSAAEFFELDIANLEAIKPIFKGKEVVFHIAAIPSVPRSIADPVSTFRSNIMGTLNVLIASRDNSIKRVVYSASSSAYGNQDALPLGEEFVPRPLSPYALSKLVGEQLCSQFTNIFNLDTISLRYFNVYGPRMSEGAYAAVVATFLRQRSESKPLTIVGDGLQKRDFTFVSDIVEANMLAALTKGRGEVINIGAGDSHSILELAELIGGEIVRLKERPGEIRNSLADISKAKRILGWEPKVTLEEGIARLKELYTLQ